MVGDIKRLFNLKDAMKLLDFADESTSFLKGLLLKTPSSPLYLKNSEGKKWIVFLLSLDADFVEDLSKAIKVQIPNAKKQVLKGYGECYLRAWKSAEKDSEARTAIEDKVFQPLMEGALLCANAALQSNILTVLHPLHEAKKGPDVDALLYKLYGPLLWRSLKAANPMVRMNSLSVFSDTFPLRDPADKTEVQNAAVLKGLKLLEELLLDTNPSVRVAAADAVGRTLGTFWNMVPTDSIRSLLNILCTKHACDSTSTAVRVGVINCMMIILENPDSHALLRPLLPHLKNLIHDNVEKVRLAMVKLLLRVKKIRGIRFYHVVTVEHLKARIASESDNINGPVAVALTELFMSSYFPEETDATEQINRTMSFLRDTPKAARVFFSNLAAHKSTGHVAKFSVMLLKVLDNAVLMEKQKKEDKAKSGSKTSDKKRGRQSASKEAEEPEEGISAEETSLMAEIVETISVLWESIRSKLSMPSHSDSKKYLLDAFGGSVLTDVHVHFEHKSISALKYINELKKDDSDAEYLNEHNHEFRHSQRCSYAIMGIAGMMPASAVTGLTNSLIKKITETAKKSAEVRRSSLDGEEEEEEFDYNLTPHVALLCLWGKTDDVCSCLAKSIRKAFVDGEDGPELEEPVKKNSKKNSKKRKQTEVSKPSKNSSLPDINSQSALVILTTIMAGKDASSKSARSEIISNGPACEQLESALETARVMAERMMSVNNVGLITNEDIGNVVAACEIYGRMSLHREAALAGDKELQFNPQARGLLTWLSDRVFSVLTAKNTKNSGVTIVGGSDVTPAKNKNSTPESPGFGDLLSPIAKEPSGKRNKTTSGGGEMQLYAKAMVTALLKTGLVLFSEWLVCGVKSAATEIGNKIEKWAVLLHGTGDNIDYKGNLYLAFCKLILQLFKCEEGQRSGAKAFKQLLRVEKMDDNEKKLLKRLAASIMCMKDKNCGSLVLIQGVLSECNNDGGSAKKVLPKTVNELLDDNCADGARVVMELIVGSGNACKELATFLFKEIKKMDEDEKSLNFEQRVIGCIFHCGNKNAQFEIAKVLNYYEGGSKDESESLMSEQVKALAR